MRINFRSTRLKEIIIGLTLILLSALSNLVLNANLPIQKTSSTSEYKLENKSNVEISEALEADPNKLIILNFLGIGFVAAFIFGIVNFILLSKNIYNRSLIRKGKSSVDFAKALPFPKALLCIASVYLWFTLSKTGQIFTLIQLGNININHSLIMTFIVQILSIISMIYLSSINFFRFSKRIIKQIPAIFYFYLALIPSSMLLAMLSGMIAKIFQYPIEPMPLIEIMASGKLSNFAYILLGIEAVVFAPIFEELLFRGVIFACLRKKFSFTFSALVSAMIFSFVHEHYLSFLPIVLLAITFSYLYEKTKNLLYPIILHAIYNGFSLLSVTLLKDIIN